MQNSVFGCGKGVHPVAVAGLRVHRQCHGVAPKPAPTHVPVDQDPAIRPGLATGQVKGSLHVADQGRIGGAFANRLGCRPVGRVQQVVRVGPPVDEGPVVGAGHKVQPLVGIQGQGRTAMVVDAFRQTDGAAGLSTCRVGGAQHDPGRAAFLLRAVQPAHYKVVAASQQLATGVVGRGPVRAGARQANRQRHSSPSMAATSSMVCTVSRMSVKGWVLLRMHSMKCRCMSSVPS